MNCKTILSLLVFAIILSIIPTQAFAQIITTNVDTAVVDLRITPSHVYADSGTYPIGFVNLINKNGFHVTPGKEVTINLKSDNPHLASVPSTITIPANQDYAVFDITVSKNVGETIISANFNGQTTFHDFKVGENEVEFPDSLELAIHLPSKEMHVDTKMPFSLYLHSDGNVIRAPKDIPITLELEKDLISIDKEILVIHKGNYYSWGTITTNDKVGNAFLKANQKGLNLNSAQDIKISSSLPSGLEIEIFPEIVGKEIDRNIDVIVSLVDSEGFPTLAQEDISLEFFSDVDYVDREIKETMDDSLKHGIIPKGDFSYHYTQELDLNQIKPEIIIGASTEGLGIATDCFVIRDIMNFENPLAENKTLNLFTLDMIPSDSNTEAIYQIGAHVDIAVNGTNDDEDEDQCVDLSKYDEESESSESGSEGSSTKSVFYPILSNEHLQSTGSLQKINIISSDKLLLNSNELGNIKPGDSYATATITSGKETGEVLLSTTINGVGSTSTLTEVVNTLKHDKTLIFSPTGPDTILFDENGNYDLFIVALDGKNRPAKVESLAKYLLQPVNEIVEIEIDNTFTHRTVHSTSFNSADEETILVDAKPVGVSAEEYLEATSVFGTTPSAIVNLYFPYEIIDSKTPFEYKGFVQLTDFNDNPINAVSDIKVKLESDNHKILDIPRFVNIPKGQSYGIFPVTTTGNTGESTISTVTKGMIGTNHMISTESFETNLKISTGSVIEPIPPGESVELKIYVDDEFAQPVEGVELEIISNANTTVTPSKIRTENDGSAKINFISAEAPNISLQIIANAEGYIGEERTFDFTVEHSEMNTKSESLVLGLPDWVLYVGVAAIGVIIAAVVVFMKKPKVVLEDEDEIFEEEDI